MENKIKELFEQIEQIIEQHLNENQYNLAEKDIFLIEDKMDLLKRKLKNKKKTKSAGIFFENDQFLQKLDLDKHILEFFGNMEFKFGSELFDELAIFKIWDNMIKLIYFISTNPYKTVQIQNKDMISQIKNYILKNIDFFKNDILSENLQEWEWLLIKDHRWDPYDAVIKIDNYIIWFNNSFESLEEIKKNREVNQKEILKEIAFLYQNLRQEFDAVHKE